MDAWRRRFTRNILLAAAAFHVPVVALLASLYARALSSLVLAALCAVLTVLAANAPLYVRLLRWADHATRAHAARVWLFETPYFVHFVALLLFGPLGALALLAVPALSLLGVIAPPASLAAYLGPLYLACAAVGAYAVLVRRFWTVTHRVTVPVRDLPRELEGYTIVHLSDVHCGPYLPRWFYRRIARRASALAPDAVVLTGDLIAEGGAYLADVTDFARELRARDGVYAAMGNHDYYGTVEGVPRALEDAGVTVLRNASAVLAPDRGGGLFLAGTDDSWSRRARLDAALAGRVAAQPCALLWHDPADFPAIAARDDAPDLVLAGHTHGGQLAVPFAHARWNLARLRGRFVSGVYTHGRSTLFVHRGNGTSGPPARLGAAPEIAVLVLTRA